MSDTDGKEMNDRAFWLMVRQALLMFVDAIERRYLPNCKRTSETRHELELARRIGGL